MVAEFVLTIYCLASNSGWIARPSTLPLGASFRLVVGKYLTSRGFVGKLKMTRLVQPNCDARVSLIARGRGIVTFAAGRSLSH